MCARRVPVISAVRVIITMIRAVELFRPLVTDLAVTAVGFKDLWEGRDI